MPAFTVQRANVNVIDSSPFCFTTTVRGSPEADSRRSSTVRIGPFRTALFMNLEPLLATIGSAVFLGEVITPLQALGGAMMIAALVAFQLRR